MQIRCGACHGTMRVQTTARTTRPAIVQCCSCSQEYDFSSTLQRLDITDLFQDARVLAENNNMDIQTAASVLLGIMSLEEARDCCDPNFSSSGPPTAAGRTMGFDPTFEEAIKAGRLTPEQALLRGNRQGFSEKLMARHRLSLKQALAVADNRISLLEAIRARGRKARIELKPERSWKFVAPLPVAIAVGAVLSGAAFFAMTPGGDEAGNSEVRPGSARTELTAVEVRVNLQGELTAVSGQNPASVLAAYCESAPSGELVPVGLEASDDAWTAFYRKDGMLYALTIRRAPRSELWVVGDAVWPIRAERSLNDREPEGLIGLRQSAARERIVVERNARGTVVRVSASDPASVLLAYCQLQTAEHRCEPLELRAGIPAEAGVRFGVFRDFSEEARRKFAIRREQKHQRWIAGNGSGPIEVVAARESPPGAFAIPVGRSTNQ